jgi:hypothetical protein
VCHSRVAIGVFTWSSVTATSVLSLLGLSLRTEMPFGATVARHKWSLPALMLNEVDLAPSSLNEY